MSAQSSRYAEIRARVRKGRKGQRRGVALILVLGSLVVLMVFVTELQQTTSASVSAAVAERDAMRAEYAARSAMNLSRLLISTEPMVRKAVDPLYRMALKSPAPQVLDHHGGESRTRQEPRCQRELFRPRDRG